MPMNNLDRCMGVPEIRMRVVRTPSIILQLGPPSRILNALSIGAE
jgi:hypothetical protein